MHPGFPENDIASPAYPASEPGPANVTLRRFVKQLLLVDLVLTKVRRAINLR